MEFALVGASVELVVAEAFEDLLNVFSVVVGIVGEDEKVVEVDNDRHIDHICEDFIDKTLPGGRGVAETKGHHKILI